MKTQTKKPRVANKDKKFSNTALIGNSSEPVNRNSRIKVVIMIQSAAQGRLFVIPRSESV
jgi:hypothetical protein